MGGPRWDRWVALTALVLGAVACSVKEPTQDTYFDRTISPILQSSCVSTNTAGNCHVDNGRGNALGNLSLESYDELRKRQDLLVNYGPYGLPNLLLKNVEPYDLPLTAYDGTGVTVRTDIRHAGQTTIGLTSAGFHTLKAWLGGGASKSNATTPPLPAPRDPCSSQVPEVSGFDAERDPTTPDFAMFRVVVHPVLGETCAAGNCHGSPTNSLRLGCADAPDGATSARLARWNYFAATQYLATTSEGVSASELLRRPLDPARGGTFHEGGVIFSTPSDPRYAAVRDWAVQHGPAVPAAHAPGFDFFAKRVQPMLVKKGCMVLGCHSPAMFHDYRLRGGSGGHFSLPATQTNYDLSRAQLAMEASDPNVSRLIAKNLLRPDAQAGGRGILHRGGALFDDFGAALASPQACDLTPGGAAETGKLDEQHAYCVIARWIQIEQAQAKLAPLSGVVYVKRTPAPLPDLPQDFASYAPGADLCFMPLRGGNGSAAATAPVGAPECRSLLASCAGLSTGTADVRRPSVSWKGDRVAFAARGAASEPFAIWTVNVDGSGCAQQPDIQATPSVPGWSDNGAPIHNFDPAFTPDGRLVFASTRGNVMNTAAFDYHGPTRTPADVTRWNANLYIVDAPATIRQLTFLLNQELAPSLMSDGRLIYTVEKRAPGFYQLAGRRQNLDGGDYHPLFAQRNTIGFEQMTETVELANKNFAAIFSDRSAAHGAGTLGLFNRSLGIDQRSTNEADFVADPTAAGLLADPLVNKFYLHALGLLDPAATGHLGAGNAGAYRSPTRMPNGGMIVSYAANAMDLTSFSGNFDLMFIDDITGTKSRLTTDGSTDELDAVAVYERYDRGVFTSRADEANATTRVVPTVEGAGPSAADITVLDLPVLGSLLFQNTRSGRPQPSLSGLDVFEDLPPEGDPAPFTTTDAYGAVYARRRHLGQTSMLADQSARLVVPGGVPLVMRGIFALSGRPAEPVFQREEMQFYPGEFAHQSFRGPMFDGLCGGCHGSLSGREMDVAVQPDVLTQASRVVARDVDPQKHTMGLTPASRGAPEGP